MNLPLFSDFFYKEIKDKNVVAISPFIYDHELITLITEKSKRDKKTIYFIPITAKQAKHYAFLGQKMLSLNDKEIDVALDVADQVDHFNNFVKLKTHSFIRDKMIAQSALKLIVLTNTRRYVPEITLDVCVEISTFAWQRTLIHLQSFGEAKVLYEPDSDFVKTEANHYLVKIKLDKNISLEDFEYSVRNISGVLETGVFLSLADVIFIYNFENETLAVKR